MYFSMEVTQGFRYCITKKSGPVSCDTYGDSEEISRLALVKSEPFIKAN